MNKLVDALTQASIDSGQLAGVILGKFHFDPILRYTNAYQDIYWDEAGTGEVKYQGLGHLASISTLTESQELSAQTIQLTISGIPNQSITDIFGNTYIGQPCYLWYATLNKQTYAVEGGQNGPVLIFAGNMDYGNITFGDTGTIILNVTSRLADWERPRGGRFNDGYQRRHVDPTDSGFKFVEAIQNKPINWGGVTLSDPGSSSGRNHGGKCFSIDTKFYMQDGSLKKIQDIVPGDIMLYGGKVGQVSFGLGDEEDWYDYMGTIVTGSHAVLEEGSWILLKDSKKAIPTYTRSHTYVVCNDNHVMVAENKESFADDVFTDLIWSRAMDEEGLSFLNDKQDLNEELRKLKL
jgi:hypothetical protein